MRSNQKSLQKLHPMRVVSHRKSFYFITFIDNCRNWTEIRLTIRKRSVIDEFNKFRAFMSTQLNFDNLLKNHVIKRHLTAPYNPEQNGIAESLIRTLIESASCLMIQAGLPPISWAEAVNTVNFIHNRSPVSKLDGKSPFQVWHRSTAAVGNAKRFRNEVYIMDRHLGKGKLESHANRGIFLGYSEESKAYRIFMSEMRKV